MHILFTAITYRPLNIEHIMLNVFIHKTIICIEPNPHTILLTLFKKVSLPMLMWFKLKIIRFHPRALEEVFVLSTVKTCAVVALRSYFYLLLHTLLVLLL